MRLSMPASFPLVKLLYLERPPGQRRMVRDGIGLVNLISSMNIFSYARFPLWPILRDWNLDIGTYFLRQWLALTGFPC